MGAVSKYIPFVLCILSSIAEYASADEILQKSPFSIVIDGGSTGSRLHIFEFVPVNDASGKTDCIRRGSDRSFVPLSAFGRTDTSIPINATAVADHIVHVFDYAAQIVPPEYHLSTSVKFAATAGMRLLEEDEQEAVYDALYQGLVENEKFVFRGLARDDIFTLSGDLEGFYGAVAANFLEGLIDTSLGPVGDSSEASHGPLGALDMGGSSTQIVYLPHVESDTCENEQCEQTQRGTAHLAEEEFFSTSYLAYGVDRFRERLWETWVQDRRKEASEECDGFCDAKIIDNPCTFPGYEIEWKGYTLLGTGNSSACIEQVQRLIPHYEPDEQLGGRVGGVKHPPVRGKFFAMSLFYFSLDSLRVLSHPSKEAHDALNLSWPTPSIQELHDALDGLCSRNWHEDLAEIQHEAHVYTRADVLPHRCLESVYMVSLLRDGFGFAPESRDITFCFLVDGSEVEWSLGYALSQHAEQRRVEARSERGAKANATKDECSDVAMESTRS
ncbi:GDA1/CD39 (nucleoside phosphatase) family [Fragilaria crotonensis]|nr:GDA1/CD39 (nucleoside phosphatase) family [Fragilaria crotonensis]